MLSKAIYFKLDTNKVQEVQPNFLSRIYKIVVTDINENYEIIEKNRILFICLWMKLFTI